MKMEDHFTLPVETDASNWLLLPGNSDISEIAIFWRENAHVAAHAINCYDELVEALEAARQEIVASAMADQRNDAGFSTDSALWAKRAMDWIDAALTKAKGE